MMNRPATYIGHSTDKRIRYNSSSGGITTSIYKYLFGNGLIGSALTCKFNQGSCRYENKIIHSFDDYELVGSIYQDTDIFSFLRENISCIKGSLLVVCAPCQTKGVRSILSNNGIDSIIINYFCSGQTAIEGTYCYYKFLGIEPSQVTNIRYRGNGWPNGIEITLNDGTIIKKPNYTEPWKTIHQSRLFRPKRCLNCRISINESADICVGDPWLEEFKDETIGENLFLVHSKKGVDIIQQMHKSRLIDIYPVNYEMFLRSQHVLEKSQFVDKNKELIRQVLATIDNPSALAKATESLSSLKKHIKLMNRKQRFYNFRHRSLLDNIKLVHKKVFKKIFKKR